ncbi:uncharacterized protein METZ01_LOCUS233477, partial [marine metagenome]
MDSLPSQSGISNNDTRLLYHPNPMPCLAVGSHRTYALFADLLTYILCLGGMLLVPLHQQGR